MSTIAKNHSKKTAYIFTVFAIFNATANSQTLNDVVADELATIAGVSCVRLLGADNPLVVLTGNLQNLCTRNAPVGSSPPASSGGGGAATPSNLPRIIKKRLQYDEEAQNNGGASADLEININNSINFFMSGEYQSLDRDVTNFEDGYDSDIWHLVAGADYSIEHLITLGAAFDYRHQEGDYASSGGFRQDSYGVLTFVNITPLDNTFIQISGGYSGQNNERRRLASFSDTTGFTQGGFAASEYDANEYSAGFLAGYDFNINQYTFGPRAGLDWVRTEYDSYSESGTSGLELRFAEDYRTSLQSRLGLFGSAAFSTGFGIIVPQVGIDWIHEFKNDQRGIRFSFAGDLRNKRLTFQNERPDRDFLEINVGASIVFAHGFQGFVNYRAIAGHSYFDGHSANFGLRMEF